MPGLKMAARTIYPSSQGREERLKSSDAIGAVAHRSSSGGGSDCAPTSGSGSARSPAEMEEDATRGRQSLGAEARVGVAA